MTQFLIMQLERETDYAAQSPQVMAQLVEARKAYAGELRDSGKLRDSARLRPSKEGKRVRRVGAQPQVSDGPFDEQGASLGGYYWLEAESLAEAVSLAARCPGLASDEFDVRPLMKGQAPAGKEAKPGKLFVCAVLGNAESETAWVDIMDRIDAESDGQFPEQSFLGGLRLQPPKSGKRVVNQGERRAIFDGPFLESKEVIGGVFVMRAATQDEVVAWATTTRFVVHGALEIRELWRT